MSNTTKQSVKSEETRAKAVHVDGKEERGSVTATSGRVKCRFSQVRPNVKGEREKQAKKRRCCRGASSHWPSPRRFCVSGENGSLPVDNKKRKKSLYNFLQAAHSLRAATCTATHGAENSLLLLSGLNNGFPSSVDTLLLISFQKARGESCRCALRCRSHRRQERKRKPRCSFGAGVLFK